MINDIRSVLFIDTTHPCLKEELVNMGFQCDYFPSHTREDFEKCIHQYFGVIIRSKIKLDKQILNKAKNLKFIGRVGSGLENIDVKYAESLGITCLNSPEGNRVAVGEHILGMLLALFNNLCRANSQVKNNIWHREENRGIEIKGKTIGIIGYGNTGSAFAQRLKGFEANVIGYDKYKFNYSDEFITEATLERIFEEADILTMHVPLTQETYYMVNDEFINKFKKNIYILNSSRGKVLSTDALVKNLKSGKVLGAALDVIEYESSSLENLEEGHFSETFQYLADSDNVILSPHIAGWTIESKYKLAKVLADKIYWFLTGLQSKAV